MQHWFGPRRNKLSGGLAAAAAVALLLGCSLYVFAAGADGLNKGMELAKQGKYKEAVLALQSAPPSSTNCYYQGYCYYQLHHEAEAKQLFAAVAERYPKSAEAKLAVDFLKRLDPGYQVAAPASAEGSAPGAASGHGSGSAAGPAPVTAAVSGLGSSSTSSARSSRTPNLTPGTQVVIEFGNETPPDMTKLPDEARIFYTTASSGHMVVDAAVNGHPYKCWFDTGAPGLLFGKNNLRAMGVPLPRGPANTSVSGWAGVRLPAWTMNLTVKIGSVERTLPATIQEELDLPPLIGYSFVQGYQYEIDEKARCMMLKKEQNNQQSLNSLYDVPCRVLGTKSIVVFEVNGKKVPAFIDTGASNTIMSPLTAAAVRLEIPSDAPAIAAGGIGGASAYRVVNVDLRLGPIIRKDFPVLIGGNAGSCVGQDFLQGWRFTVDEKKGYMRFFH